MIQTILFDLDDTLLGNDMERFMPGYFSLISKYARNLMEERHFMQELLICTQHVIENTDTQLTNRDVFWQTFQQRNDLDPNELEPFFHEFYRREFPKLQAVTEFRPTAVPLIQTCFDLGLQVVIATNPLFPRIAIEERLAWAGVPVNEFDYALVTTYENMHATKPHTAYYEEILTAVNCPPQSALMIGDDWEMDIEPAAQLGMSCYWLPGQETELPDPALATAAGTLENFYDLVQSSWLTTLPKGNESHVRTTPSA
ncbi:MAG: HAD family hydrolase [Ardenticatenaceae bacterium]|nr:HAD family hydrolase [Anaerolineales bacterium]MCB8920403.1 HAD family hydrolase [Ardenticatenaceae bacterium]MCB8989358.1 HAD family hydrolase [Ardenticatenaceae bacterium]MCB9004513.1 HAD family hydrolase [Ardenticatenaceae bacterium]